MSARHVSYPSCKNLMRTPILARLLDLRQKLCYSIAVLNRRAHHQGTQQTLARDATRTGHLKGGLHATIERTSTSVRNGVSD